ncbi:MAG TPA: ABC transporter ATP-binding protein, partial [Streptomyces sp.]|nr:ABC transporter ATP-binding protein [Streptomyces sp.]
MSLATKPLIETTGLTVEFGGKQAVRGLSLAVHPGECLGVVGESGSGKSVTARTLIGLAGPGADVRADSLRVDGKDASRYTDSQWRKVRGSRIGLVLQDALASLDPLRRVGQEIAEALRLHRAVPRGEAAARAVQLLRTVGVPEPEIRARQYPHELSGGLRQRALIASALACDPPLVVADEPTTALDVTVQAQILALLARQKEAGTALLLISHDLAVVSQLADRVLVMKDGAAVEEGPARQVLTAPEHPYTRELLGAVPSVRSPGLAVRTPGAAVRPAAVPPPVPTQMPPAAPPTAVRRSPALLEARGVTKAFGRRRVLDDVSFSLSEGETLGLVGESGSGKTTLARVALGLTGADRGDVLVDGRSWKAMKQGESRRARRGIQMVHQDPLGSFDPRFNVRRVLEEALEVGGVPRSNRRGRAGEL